MKKILIANRGEIAVRIIRACQELDIKTVAIHSLADKESLHTKLADESICIGPAPSVKSYLHIPTIMSAAELTGVDAIHPGYGFLSENFEFAQICLEYGIKFIGPTPEQIRILGNKVAARELARRAKVPMLQGSQGIIKTEEEAYATARSIGFPVIIKAANGGGGRGMKIVKEEKDLLKYFQLAQAEALTAFGNGDCFMEKYLTNPRHVEVQIIADEHGNYQHLGERDCTIQRRQQKIIEESPCAVLTEELRTFVCDRALSLVKAAGYQSLGTIEFLFDNGNFYFMEMNTRLQVEHPVTEMVYGVDLVKEQIKIASGEKISWGDNIPKRQGHAIECRINAEDPKSFVPWPGQVTGYYEPGGPGIRLDSMVYTNYQVPSYYDSMIAKVIAHGKDREEALARMRRALKEMKVEGIRTNIELHLRILQNRNFISGDVSTSFMENFLKPA